MTNRKYPGMKSGSSDDFQTEPAAADMIAPFIPASKIIWECACGKGNLVKRFTELGYLVTSSDVKTGADFLTYSLPENQYDVIVTNPPFSIKDDFLARCYELGKPFALLLPITVFDSENRRGLFKKHGVEIIMPPRRIRFETPNHKARIAEGKKPGTGWFYSVWVTHGLGIGKQITFMEIEK